MLELAVIDERLQQPAIDEAFCLQMSPIKAAWIREVVMSINGVPCIVARSLTEWQASTGIWRGIRQLGTKPLADMLYNDARVSRGSFEYTNVRHTQGLARALSNGADSTKTKPNAALFARRSLFICQVKRLLVSECFLPAFWQLTEQQTNK
jgi:chorismate--pyruvate lyase